MSNLNINVLVAAKEEYTKQLVYLLSPEVYKIINRLFQESQTMKKKRSISLRNYQTLLKKVPEWNDVLIEKNIEDIKKKIPFILDLITAIFVSHVKILGCVKLKKNKKSIKVKIPNINLFLHKIIIEISENVYYNPQIILQKKEVVILNISNIIEDSLRNQIPIDKILTEYLSGVFDKETSNEREIEPGSESESGESESDSDPGLNLDDDDKQKIEENIPINNRQPTEEEAAAEAEAGAEEAGAEEEEEEEEEEIDLEDFSNIKKITTTRPLPISQIDGNINTIMQTSAPSDLDLDLSLGLGLGLEDKSKIHKKTLFNDLTD